MLVSVRQLPLRDQPKRLARGKTVERGNISLRASKSYDVITVQVTSQMCKCRAQDRSRCPRTRLAKKRQGLSPTVLDFSEEHFGIKGTSARRFRTL